MERNRVHGRSSPVYTCLVNTKNMLTSLATREVQIKTTLRFHLVPAMVATTTSTNDSKCWRGCGDWKCLAAVGRRVSLCSCCGNQPGSSQTNTRVHMIQLYRDGTYPRDCASYCRDTGTSVHCRSAHSSRWNQLRCPFINEWTRRMRCMCTTEFYSAVKKNKNVNLAE